MLWNLGPYELIVICVVWVILVFGVPSALGVYIWRKRAKRKRPET